MKSLLFALLLSVFAPTAFCQSKVGEDRQTSWPWNFQEYEPITKTGRTTAGVATIQNVPANSRFTIVDETTLPDSYIIFFWRWEENASNRAKLNYEAAGNTVKYFIIPKHQLDIVSARIYRIFSPSVGALTFPFKYRPQNGKFEPTFGIGVSGGVTINPWRFNEHTFSVLAGVAASSARVDEFSVDPAANLTDESERTAVTVSLNFLYQWERLQIGVSIGMDNIIDNEVLKWKYQGKSWLSFGVGVGLFSSSEIRSPGKN